MGFPRQSAFLIPASLAPSQRGNGSIVDTILTDDEKDLLGVGGVPKAASGWPAAVPFRSGNWSRDWLDYTVSQRDTISGIAATYLLDPSRYAEIWSLQTFPENTPNRLNRWYNKIDGSSKNPGRAYRQGDILRMPAEAGARAKQYYEEGKPDAPPAPSAPGNKPGYQPPPKAGEVSKAGLGIGAAVVGLGALYLLTR